MYRSKAPEKNISRWKEPEWMKNRFGEFAKSSKAQSECVSAEI
jgi:hypothetical protein